MDMCPCGGGQAYAVCCQPLHEGKVAETAEALMRSRYCAYVLKLYDYLRQTWHSSMCPVELQDDENMQWLGLKIKRFEQQDESHAMVEFVARYKVNGRAFRLHETSRFVKEHGVWLYVDGLFNEEA